MKYLRWKKIIRRKTKQILKGLNIKKLNIHLTKDNERGIHIKPNKNLLIVPYNLIKKIKKDYNLPYSIIIITTTIIYHELGHYIDYKTDKIKYIKTIRYTHSLLMNALVNDTNYSKQEKIDFINQYKYSLLKTEEIAWNYAKEYCDCDISIFNSLKEIGVAAHIKTCDNYIKSIKKI